MVFQRVDRGQRFDQITGFLPERGIARDLQEPAQFISCIGHQIGGLAQAAIHRAVVADEIAQGLAETLVVGDRVGFAVRFPLQVVGQHIDLADRAAHFENAAITRAVVVAEHLGQGIEVFGDGIHGPDEDQRIAQRVAMFGRCRCVGVGVVAESPDGALEQGMEGGCIEGQRTAVTGVVAGAKKHDQLRDLRAVVARVALRRGQISLGHGGHFCLGEDGRIKRAIGAEVFVDTGHAGRLHDADDGGGCGLGELGDVAHGLGPGGRMMGTAVVDVLMERVAMSGRAMFWRQRVALDVGDVSRICLIGQSGMAGEVRRWWCLRIRPRLRCRSCECAERQRQRKTTRHNRNIETRVHDCFPEFALK